jgi:eukaryotic-like serine/threonine-protein kinase
MIGQTVGNYRITGLLGEGGMGAVFRAEHPGIGRSAAVKVLHAELARTEDHVERFFNEARAANAIRHPGIVEIFDSGMLDTGSPYIVMEFLEGESLAARCKRGRLHPAEAVDIVGQAADALAAAHAKGIVHRDLKPDNLFLVGGPVPGRDLVKILDFGIAKLGRGPGRGEGSVRTRTGAVLGTPMYMSPEQCRGTREIDHRTDIYALGVIFYEMICGQPPFLSDGFGEMAHLHISATPAPPRTHAPELPLAVEQAILIMLEKDPNARFQSMRDLQSALRQSPVPTLVLSNGAVPRPRPVEAPRPFTRPPTTTLAASATAMNQTAPPVRRSRAGLWASLLLVGAAAVAGGVLFYDRSDAGSDSRSGGRSRDPEPLRLPVTSDPVPVAPPPAAPGAGLAVPASVQVTIGSNPSGARVVREADGVILGMTPFEESWPSAAGSARLRLEKDGYRPESLVVPLDRGVNLDRALRPIPAAIVQSPRKVRSSATHGRGAPQSDVKPVPAPAPAPDPVAPPARKEPVKI